MSLLTCVWPWTKQRKTTEIWRLFKDNHLFLVHLSYEQSHLCPLKNNRIFFFVIFFIYSCTQWIFASEVSVDLYLNSINRSKQSFLMFFIIFYVLSGVFLTLPLISTLCDRENIILNAVIITHLLFHTISALV